MASSKPRPRGRTWQQTTFGPDRRAWVTGSDFEAVLYMSAPSKEPYKGVGANGENNEPYKDEDANGDYEPHEAELEGLPSTRLYMRRGAKYLTFDLSLMTVEEIECLADIFNLACCIFVVRSIFRYLP